MSAFCASLNDCDRTAIPRKSAAKRIASGTSPTSTSSAEPHGSENWRFAARPKRKTPDWKVRSMLRRLTIAAVIPSSATARNFPVTISRDGTGAVSSVSSVPRSFSPAAMSMAG